MFQLIVFLLVALFILDHNIKNRRFCFLYYKNNHRFSVGVVIRFYHDGLEKLFELAKNSHHDFYFVNINQAVPKEMFESFGLTFMDLETNLNPLSPSNITKIQSMAYHDVYSMLESDFLLFMDASDGIDKTKTIDFMANNLVEHQVFTVKETIEREKSEAHLLYFDFFKDMNLEKSNLNHYFFAIKKSTYELARCHEMICESDEDIEEAIFKKNIHIVMVDHGQAITRVNTKRSFKASLKLMNDYIVKSKRLLGLNRMTLFMVLLNVYYISILLALLSIFDLNIPYIIITLLLIHVLLYLSLREYAKHHALAYILAPFTLFLFNWVYVIGLIKRRFMTITEDLVVEEQPDPLPEELMPQEDEELLDEASKEDNSEAVDAQDDKPKEASSTEEILKEEPVEKPKKKPKKPLKTDDSSAKDSDSLPPQEDEVKPVKTDKAKKEVPNQDSVKEEKTQE